MTRFGNTGRWGRSRGRCLYLTYVINNTGYDDIQQENIPNDEMALHSGMEARSVRRQDRQTRCARARPQERRRDRSAHAQRAFVGRQGCDDPVANVDIVDGKTVSSQRIDKAAVKAFRRATKSISVANLRSIQPARYAVAGSPICCLVCVTDEQRSSADSSHDPCRVPGISARRPCSTTCCRACLGAGLRPSERFWLIEAITSELNGTKRTVEVLAMAVRVVLCAQPLVHHADSSGAFATAASAHHHRGQRSPIRRHRPTLSTPDLSARRCWTLSSPFWTPGRAAT